MRLKILQCKKTGSDHGPRYELLDERLNARPEAIPVRREAGVLALAFSERRATARAQIARTGKRAT